MWPAISRSHCSDFPKVMDSNLTWWANLTPSALGNVSDLKTKRGKHDLILSREMEVPVRHLGDAVVLLFKETHSTSRLFFLTSALRFLPAQPSCIDATALDHETTSTRLCEERWENGEGWWPWVFCAKAEMASSGFTAVRNRVNFAGLIH